ncbi:MAG TPA: hypothetical protein VKM72_08980 [Thermoanaerobaculia bacterium]|nr:hypothetical protein [Thermoanaerobaculia bacterium]
MAGKLISNGSKPAYYFRIVFSGLCAFVPDRDLDGKFKPTKMDVLLVDTNHDRAKKLYYKHDYRHLPVLKYDLKDVDCSQNTSVGDTFAHGIWTLSREQLKLEVRKRGTGSASMPPKPEAKPFKVDLPLVPRIDKIFPEARELDTGALGASPKLVVARFSVDQGEFSHYAVGHYNDEDILVKFVPSKDPSPAKPVAYKVQFTLGLASDEEVVIRSRKFGASPGAPDLRHVVFLPPADGVVAVEISNLCCGQFMGYGEAYEEVPERDTDFEYHFMLSKNFDDLAKKHVRFPISVPVYYRSERPLEVAETAAGGGETVRCNLSLFNPRASIAKVEV